MARTMWSKAWPSIRSRSPHAPTRSITRRNTGSARLRWRTARRIASGWASVISRRSSTWGSGTGAMVSCRAGVAPRSGSGRRRDDHLLEDGEGLDAADEERAVGTERLRLRRRERARHGVLVVVPQLGDAVDLDVRRRDVRPLPLLDDVRLHVATDPRHRMGERRMHVDPVR